MRGPNGDILRGHFALPQPLPRHSHIRVVQVSSKGTAHVYSKLEKLLTKKLYQVSISF